MAKIKFSPEEFKVEEILNKNFIRNKGKYRVYKLWKKGLETPEAVKKLSKLSGIPYKMFRYGGLKDKNAETVQFITVPSKYRIEEFKKENLQISFCGFSVFPMSSSVIEKNRFEIVVRERLKDTGKVEILRKAGMPNYYGEQRFISLRGEKLFVYYLVNKDYRKGIEYLFTPAAWENSRSRKGKRAFLKRNFDEAVKLLTGWRKKLAAELLNNPKTPPEKLFKLIPSEEIEFQMNVFQSFLFNKLLATLIKREERNLFVFKYRGGLMFFPEKRPPLPATIEMFHPDTYDSEYETILQNEGITPYLLKKFSRYFHRFSRRTFVDVGNLEITTYSEKTVLIFELPSGSYGTNVVRFLFNSIKFKGV